MDTKNIIILYSSDNNVLISIRAIKFFNRFDCYSIDDFKKTFDINFEKIKYFDDDGELISVINQDDFITFKDIILSKAFPNDKVRVIAYTGSIDLLKYGSLEKLKDLKVESESTSDVPRDRKSFSSTNYSSSCQEPSCYSSTSSFSSSKNDGKEPMKRKKKLKTMNRYAAKLKRDLNYLPGSQVADGQTIVKKWRVKNVGSKKWKDNTVKSVLLPSKYSDWVSCSTIEVPACFADQSIDIEVEIAINGKWNDIDSRVGESSQQVSLTWLLFKDCLVEGHKENFKEHILTTLELSIIVIKRSLDTENYVKEMTNDLENSHSESSIELIDHEYGVVNNDKSDRTNKENLAIDTSENILRLDSVPFDIELPECPQSDDSPISDFLLPSFIPVDQLDEWESQMKLVNNSNKNSSSLQQRDSETAESQRGSKARISTDQEQSFISTNTEETDLSFVLANDDDGEQFRVTGKLSWQSIDEEKVSSSIGSNEPSILSPKTSLHDQFIMTGDDSILISENNRPGLIDNSIADPVEELNVSEVQVKDKIEEEVAVVKTPTEPPIADYDDEILALLNEIDHHVITRKEEDSTRDNPTEKRGEEPPVMGICAKNGSLSSQNRDEFEGTDREEEEIIASDRGGGNVNITSRDTVNYTPSAPINIGFKDEPVYPSAPSAPSEDMVNYPVNTFARLPVSPTVSTQYQAGVQGPVVPRPVNYMVGVGNGWAYQAGVTPPQHQHQHQYQQAVNAPYPMGPYQAGAPYNVPQPGVHHNFNGVTNARYMSPPLPNTNIRPSQWCAPTTDKRRHSAGYRK